jgi:putative SbcD/Mre11-related phosphoesterase
VIATDHGLVAAQDGWWLSPEGAVVHLDERTAVIADVHLGYEWSRGAGGDVVPAHSLAETLAAVGRLFDRTEIDRLVVAGDLVESGRRCFRTSSDLKALRAWLAARAVELVPLLGNHDSQRHPRLPLTLEVGGWTIGHGHRPIDATRTITGHDHPIFRAGGTSARCFLVGPSEFVLPAFSSNAAGLNVAQGPTPKRWRGRGFRCWASSGTRLLDFGPIDDLATRLASA